MDDPIITTTAEQAARLELAGRVRGAFDRKQRAAEKRTARFFGQEIDDTEDDQ